VTATVPVTVMTETAVTERACGGSPLLLLLLLL
jgi:hypothetical protein